MAGASDGHGFDPQMQQQLDNYIKNEPVFSTLGMSLPDPGAGKGCISSAL